MKRMGTGHGLRRWGGGRKRNITFKGGQGQMNVLQREETVRMITGGGTQEQLSPR